MPSGEIKGATLTALHGTSLGTVPTDARPDQVNFGAAAAPAEARFEAERRRADRDAGVVESLAGPADYVAFAGAPAPNPRTAPTTIVADSLCRIIEAGGPMLAKRAYDV